MSKLISAHVLSVLLSLEKKKKKRRFQGFFSFKILVTLTQKQGARKGGCLSQTKQEHTEATGEHWNSQVIQDMNYCCDN